MRRAPFGLLTLGLVVMAVAPQQLVGQLRPLGHRVTLGLAGTLARPVGEFQRFVDWGGGAAMYGVFNLDRGRHLGLRVDGSFVVYGHERYEAPLTHTIPRIVVDVTTDNFVASFGVGPQLTMGRGWLRPYVYGTAGLSYFATVSSLSGTADSDRFASTTNFDDATLQLTGGAGVLIRLTRARHPVLLDLSVQQTLNGEAEYLRRGGIIDRPRRRDDHGPSDPKRGEPGHL